MTYVPQPQKVEGGQNKVWVADDNVRQLLLRILKEMRIMNIHLEAMTDEQIKEV